MLDKKRQEAVDELSELTARYTKQLEVKDAALEDQKGLWAEKEKLLKEAIESEKSSHKRTQEHARKMESSMQTEREEWRAEKARRDDAHKEELSALQLERDRAQQTLDTLKQQIETAVGFIAEMHGLTELSATLQSQLEAAKQHHTQTTAGLWATRD